MPKAYAELQDAAHKRSIDRYHRVWVLLHDVNRRDLNGCGIVPVRALHERIRRHRLRGLSPASVSRILAEGSGLWWRVFRHEGQRWVELRGLRRVCASLGVRLRSDPVDVDWRYIRTLKGFRAILLYGRWRAGANPISRAAIETMTGVSPATQRNYARFLGSRVRVVHNATLTRRTPADDLPDGYYIDIVDDALRVVKRLPNSYECNATLCARGQIRKVNRVNSDRLGGSGPRRLYHRKARSAVRREFARVEGDAWFSLGGDANEAERVYNARSGALLWTHHYVLGGRLFCE